MSIRKPTRADVELLSPICQAHGKTVDQARVILSDGRKVGYILSMGTISSRNCFHFETPTPSFKNDSASRLPGCVIPDGWKIAFNVKGSAYMGEVVYTERGIALFRFSQLQGADIVKQSCLETVPTRAFSQVLEGCSDQGDASKTNGRLLIGVQYSEPQRLILEYFSSNPWAVKGDDSSYMLATLVDKSLEEFKDSFNATSRKRMMSYTSGNCDYEAFMLSPNMVDDIPLLKSESINVLADLIPDFAEELAPGTIEAAMNWLATS